MSPEDLAPGFVPERFARRRTHSGDAVQSLSGKGERTVVLHFDKADPYRPLEIGGTSDRGAQLTGTEQHPGAKVDVGVPGVETVYHDGQWSPGPGPGAIDNGEVVIHWDTSKCHSLTATLPAGLVTVRAPRSVDLDGLLRILRSVPAVAAS